MRGHIEHTGSIVRVFSDGHAYGDPYCYSCSIQWHSPTHAEVAGVLRAPTSDEWRAIRRVLKEAGATDITFTRKKSGKSTEHKVKM